MLRGLRPSARSGQSALPRLRIHHSRGSGPATTRHVDDMQAAVAPPGATTPDFFAVLDTCARRIKGKMITELAAFYGVNRTSIMKNDDRTKCLGARVPRWSGPFEEVALGTCSSAPVGLTAVTGQRRRPSFPDRLEAPSRFGDELHAVAGPRRDDLVLVPALVPGGVDCQRQLTYGNLAVAELATDIAVFVDEPRVSRRSLAGLCPPFATVAPATRSSNRGSHHRWPVSKTTLATSIPATISSACANVWI